MIGPRAFNDPALAKGMLGRIAELAKHAPFRIMEVCGTHTVAIARSGIRELLPPGIKLVSGPGCPVCVTPSSFLDRAIALSLRPGTVIATFGDLLRVPGSHESLEVAAARGGKIETVYSPLDALDLAISRPESTVVFLGVGFETTTPGIAATILAAAERKLGNFKVLSAHKVMPPPLKLLASDPEVGVDGFLLPGHVSAIAGPESYDFIPLEHGIPSVIAGFEPLEILGGILQLLMMEANGRAEVLNLYPRVVRPGGNRKARELTEKVFEPGDAHWRGLGMIPGSGLKLRSRWQEFDASSIEVELPEAIEPAGCRCGEVLRGTLDPWDCPLFGRVCQPDNPVGACMVSSEGSCGVAHRHRGED